MAIDDILDGAAQRVSAAMGGAHPDPAVPRRRLVDRAAACLAAIRDGGTSDDWLRVADVDTIAFSPRTDNGQPLSVNGKTTTFWAAAGIEAAVRAFHDAAARGDFDDQLASGGAPTVSPKIEGERLPADADNGSLSTGGGRTAADETATRFTEHGATDDR